ncbi:MAG: chemotaxis protein CheX, partial [Candidatus Eisenbacteria bacterium]|nr:chemotaxis protein CheX [Candidatus Eisenbacteria bacterium]
MAETQVIPEESLSSPHRDALLKSVEATFGAICGESPVFAGESAEAASASNVLGIIAVVGDLSWSVTLGFPQQTAEQLACKFAGFEIPFESSDMGDVVGELANVLAGDLVAQLDRNGVKAVSYTHLTLP